LVHLDARFGLVAERRRFELDVVLGEPSNELRAIGRGLRRSGVEALESLNLGDEERANARREAAASLVALRVGEVDGRCRRLRLLVLLLQLLWRGRRVEGGVDLLARLAFHRRARWARVDGLLGLGRDALASRGERGRGAGRRSCGAGSSGGSGSAGRRGLG